MEAVSAMNSDVGGDQVGIDAVEATQQDAVPRSRKVDGWAVELGAVGLVLFAQSLSEVPRGEIQGYLTDTLWIVVLPCVLLAAVLEWRRFRRDYISFWHLLAISFGVLMIFLCFIAYVVFAGVR